VGAGAGSSVVVVVVGHWGRSSSSWGPGGRFLLGGSSLSPVLPTLRAGAHSGGNGWWVGVVGSVVVGGISARQCDVAGLRGWWGAYLAGIPLHGPPGASLFLLAVRWSSPRHPPCEQRLAAVGGRWACAGCVGCRFRACGAGSILENELKQLVSIIKHETKRKKTYSGPNDDLVVWAARVRNGSLTAVAPLDGTGLGVGTVVVVVAEWWLRWEEGRWRRRRRRWWWW
jgi:hypothetical protein